MRYGPSALLAGGLGFAVSFLVACGGGSGLLSGDQARTLNGQLDQVSSALSAGDCAAVSSASASLSNAVLALPPSVNSTLRANLTQGISTVDQLAQRECRHATQATPTNTAPATTTTSSSQTSATPTAPSRSTTTTTPATTSAPATTPTGSGTTSTGGSGGAGLGRSQSGGGDSGGGSATGNGNGNGNGNKGD
jgi:hypothetical protein